MFIRRTFVYPAISIALAACTSTSNDSPYGASGGAAGASSGTAGSAASGGAGAPSDGGQAESASGTGGYAGTDGGGYAEAGSSEAAGHAGADAAGTGGYAGAGGAEYEDSGIDAPPAVTTLQQPSRGSAAALSPDDATAVIVNRDVGSVSVLALQYPAGSAPIAQLTREVTLGDGSEPWQAVVGPDSDTAYVVLRKDQKVARIRYLRTAPVLDSAVAVGSEPTSIALNPTGSRAYVTNWTDGTVSELDTATMTVLSTIDLNAALVATGLLGEVTPRPALAHPRSLVVTNDGDADDK